MLGMKQLQGNFRERMEKTQLLGLDGWHVCDIK